MNSQESFEKILARVRGTLHPDVPQDLVREILRIQIDIPDNDSEARRQLLVAIDKFVKDKGALRAGTE
jgi:hypothetical protein